MEFIEKITPAIIGGIVLFGTTYIYTYMVLKVLMTSI